MKRFLIIASRVVLGGVFIAASVHKILDPAAFALSIYRYQLVPYEAINLIAVFLPWLELLSGLALIAARGLRQAAAIVILGMLVVFTAGIASAMYRGIDISCGCFTSSAKAAPVSWLNLLRNATLIALGFLSMLPTTAPAASSPRAAGTASAS